jgi:hypothetical protein
MSAQEVIDQIKHLPPEERLRVTRFVVENENGLSSAKCTVTVGDDRLPLIRANGGVITSRLVHELESMMP